MPPARFDAFVANALSYLERKEKRGEHRKGLFVYFHKSCEQGDEPAY